MRLLSLVGFLLFMLSVPYSSVQAQDQPEPPLIRLQTATVAAAAPDAGSSPETLYYLVQFAGPVEALWVQQIEALGGHVLGYIPDNTHIVHLPADALPNVRSLPSVHWVGPYLPAYKVSPALALQAAQADPNGALIEVLVLGFQDRALAELEALLAAHGATTQAASQSPVGPLVRAVMPASALAALAQEPLVNWVELYQEAELANAEGRKIMGAEAVWQNYGYFGAGQIVAISDSGLSVQNNLSPDIGNRLVRAFAPSEMNLATAECTAKTNWTDLHGHGTHVAGSVLGGGVRSGSNPGDHRYTGSHAGVAPEAQLVFMSLNTDGSSGIQCIDLNGDFIVKGYQTGARISTNSWNMADQGGYNMFSSLVDDFIWRHKDYLVLYSAGNAGPGTQTVGSPGTAKNVLTVGATENYRPDIDTDSDNPNAVIGFSGRGPTADGRIKPDVVAPGTWILSMRAPQAPDGNFWGNFNNDYAFMGGTSMATPLTAGSAALVREWLGKTRGLTNPSAALLKALIINGAIQLPGEPRPSIHSGNGRVDLKNTLGAHYALMDDHVAGLTTGNSVTYEIEIVASSAFGSLLTTELPALVSAEVQAAALAAFQLTDTTPAVAAPQSSAAPAFTGEPLPTFAAASQQKTTPIVDGADKQGLAPLVNAVPALETRTGSSGESRFVPRSPEQPVIQSYQYNMVGGGDFEDPAWAFWSYVWLGEGIPVRTANPAYVISGNHSMWLGGTASNDALFYPVQFPDAIDNDFPSGIGFDVGIIDNDLDQQGNAFDQFCVALIDISGNFIGPYAASGPECVGVNGLYNYEHIFSAETKQALADVAAYVVVYTEGDGFEPHMSGIVDNVGVWVDFPDVTLTPLPAEGVPGTTFLLTGKYNLPYSEVFICDHPCSEATYITSAYADARGDIAVFLYSDATTASGTYPIQAWNVAGRAATTNLTILGEATPTLAVNPARGPAGTKFQFAGSHFLPNDRQIQVTLNGESLGTVGSNDAGEVAFDLSTPTNAPASSHTLQLTDSAGRSGTVTFVVTAVAGGDPLLTVTPAAGPPGTTFTFQASNFAEGTAVVELEGQLLGEITFGASGATELTLSTSGETPPGTYTLAVSQTGKRATAQYEVTSGGTAPQTGTGLYLTLVWVDPPAQVAAAQTLVNDLDLIVDTPDGTRLVGNGSAADRRNNVEVVRLENPTPGKYTVTVQAQRVNGTFGAQPFALVATTKQNFDSHNSNADLDQNRVGSLTGVVFADLNRNGVRDQGETGLAGIRVVVRQANGALSQQSTTDATGAYRFTDLPFDTYTLEVQLPAGSRMTTATSLTAQVNRDAGSGPTIGVVHQLFLPLTRNGLK